MLRWPALFLLGLAVVAGGACWLQRQSGAQLREEIVLLRDENQKLAQLRAENAKLVAAQPPAAELERLRSDRAAVVQFRTEIDKLKTGVDERERALKNAAVPPPPSAKKVPIPVLKVLPVGTWKDAGRATPTAALETMLWAGSSGNVEALSSLLVLDAEAGAAAQKGFDAAPTAEQQQYRTPLRRLAALLAREMPDGDVSVVNVKAAESNATSATIDTMLKDRDGSASKGKFEFVQVDGRWLLKVPTAAVEHLAGQ